jgi:hypothetical protein
MFGGVGRYIRGFGEETWAKETIGKPRRKREDNIK